MGERLQIPMALWRLHFQLLGNVRRMAIVFIVYAAIVTTAGFASFSIFKETAAADVAAGLVNALTGIQVFLVTLGGCNALHKATLRDYESKMIESHRLTPMSNISVALGYLFGPTLQITSLFFLNLVIGIPLVALEARPIGSWLVGNLILFNGCLTLWAATVCLGMRPAKPPNSGPIVIAIAMLTVPAMMIPGLGLFLGTYSVMLALWVMTGGVSVASVALIPTAGVAFVFTLFWLSAAAAKYRRPDLPALNAVRGHILLLFWLASSVGGIIAFRAATRANMRAVFDEDIRLFQWVATLIGSLLVAAVPISGAVDCRYMIARGASPRGWADRISDLLTAASAAALISIVAIVVAYFGAGRVLPPAPHLPDADWESSWRPTVAACFLALITVRGVMAAIYPLMKSAKVVAVMILLLAWGLPPAIDGIRIAYLRDAGQKASLSYLTGCSPAGTIANAWYQLEFEHWPGLAIQAVVAALATFLAWQTAYKIRKASQATH